MNINVKPFLGTTADFLGKPIGNIVVFTNMNQQELFFIVQQWYDKDSLVREKINKHIKKAYVTMEYYFEPDSKAKIIFQLYNQHNPEFVEPYAYMLAGMFCKLYKEEFED